MKTLILYILFFIISSPITLFSQWYTQSLNSNNGYPNMHNSRVQFLNENTGYTCGTNNMVLKTTNAGLNWIDISPQTSNVLLWGMYFRNVNTGYVTGNFGYGAKTTNGGVSWATYNFPTPDTVWSVYFVNDNVGFASGSTGHIFKTTNGGVNWVSKNSGVIDHLRVVKFLNENIGYIGTHQSYKLLKTVDQGETWTSITTNQIPALIDLDLYSENFIMGGGGTGRAGKSFNSGLNWQTITQFSTARIFSVKVFDENKYIFGCEQGLIYITTNGGLNFTQSVSNTTYGINSIYFTNPNIGYAVCGGTNNWIGVVGCIIKTTNGGVSWFKIAENSQTPQNISFDKIIYKDSDLGWLVTSDRRILNTSNGGDNWSLTYTSPEIINNFDIYENKSIVVNNAGRILVSNNLTNWSQLNLGVTNNLLGVDIIDNNNIILCGTNGIILRSSNGGNSWQIISSPVNTKLNQVRFLDANTGLISGNGVILRSTDAGFTWNNVYNISGRDLFGVDIHSQQLAFVTGTNGTLLKSTNFGLNWTPLNLGLTNTIYDVKIFNGNVIFLCGTNGLILKSLNSGISWNFENSSTSRTLKSINLINSSSATASGEFETIIRNDNLITNISNNNSIIPNEFNLSQNYPNPFNPITNIEFSLPYDTYVKLEVFNIKGQVVETLVSQELSRGYYNYSWNATNKSSGIYYYILTADNYYESKKMILIK